MTQQIDSKALKLLIAIGPKIQKAVKEDLYKNPSLSPAAGDSHRTTNTLYTDTPSDKMLAANTLGAVDNKIIVGTPVDTIHDTNKLIKGQENIIELINKVMELMKEYKPTHDTSDRQEESDFKKKKLEEIKKLIAIIYNHFQEMRLENNNNFNETYMALMTNLSKELCSINTNSPTFCEIFKEYEKTLRILANYSDIHKRNLIKTKADESKEPAAVDPAQAVEPVIPPAAASVTATESAAKAAVTPAVEEAAGDSFKAEATKNLESNTKETKAATEQAATEQAATEQGATEQAAAEQAAAEQAATDAFKAEATKNLELNIGETKTAAEQAAADAFKAEASAVTAKRQKEGSSGGKKHRKYSSKKRKITLRKNKNKKFKKETLKYKKMHKN